MRLRGILIGATIAVAVAAMLFTVSVPVAVAGPIGFSVRSNVDQHLYSIDLATGAATDLGLVNFADAEGLAFVGSTLYTIGGSVDEFWNITTPPGALVGATGSRFGIDAGLAYDSTSGTMYNIQGGPGASELYTINVASGLATSVGSDNDDFGDGLAISSSGQAFTADAIFADGLYGVNLANGVLNFIGGFGIGNISLQTGLSFDSASALYMLLSDGGIYTVNTGSGAATFVANVNLSGQNIGGFEGLAIAAVPEPATLLLIGTGLVGLVGFRRKFRA